MKWPLLKYIAITDPSCICLLGFVSLQLLLAAGNFLDKKEGKKKTSSHIFWNIWSLSYFLQDWLSEAFKRQTSIYQKTRNMRWTELLFFHFLQMTVFSFKRIEKKIVSLTSKSCSSNHFLIIVPNEVFRLAIFRLDWLWTLMKYLPLGPSLNFRA